MGLRYAQIAYVAAFTALAVALGFLLAGIPNLELMTLTVFVGGAVAGPRLGAVIGGGAALIHSLANPLGPPPFVLLLVGQVVGLALAGAMGGVLARWVVRARPAGQLLGMAAVGFAVTLLYDALTNLGVGIHLGPIWQTLVGGLLFSVMHVVANTVTFVVLGVPALRVLNDMGRLWGEG